MVKTYTLVRRILCGILFLSTFQARAQPVLTYTTPISGLTLPVDLVNAGDGSNRLFIVQQAGMLKMFSGGVTTNFLDLTAFVPFAPDERGVLSMAFHPDYNGTTNRYFFVYYTTTTAGITSIKISRYQTVAGNPNLGDPASGQEVFSLTKPNGENNHNGGKLNFGSDGMLYFGTGDGGGGNDPNNNAQNGNSLFGKMLRIDINGTDLGFYSIPPDNPYAASGDGIRDEIWAMGLRNPFRWSFDPLTNAMWIADVGQGQREEINYRAASPTAGGINYGWRCYEGNLQPPPTITACDPLPSNYVAPVFEYTHNSGTGGFSVTGGVVYRGTGSPNLYGYYIFADYVSGNVWVMTPGFGTTQMASDRTNISAFGVDESGEIYMVSRSLGVVYNVQDAFVLPVSLVRFTGRNLGTVNELKWTTASEQEVEKFIVEYSTDGINYTVAGEVPATNNSNGSGYSFNHAITNNGKIYYRLKMQDLNTSSKYSAVIVLGDRTGGSVKVYPTIVTNNRIDINSSLSLDKMRVFDAGGRQLFSQDLNGRDGYFSVQLPALQKGVYYVQLNGKDYQKSEKIIVQ